MTKHSLLSIDNNIYKQSLPYINNNKQQTHKQFSKNEIYSRNTMASWVTSIKNAKSVDDLKALKDEVNRRFLANHDTMQTNKIETYF